VLLGNTNKPLAASHLKIAAIVLFLPAVWFASWPYRAAPLLIVLGLATELLPIRKRWPNWLAGGAVTAGVVLFVQALTLELYAAHTAYTHELPWPMPDLLAGIATLLGIDATADGSAIVMHSMRQVHRLGATWELLLDPATLLFFVGGLTMLAIRGTACHPESTVGLPEPGEGDAETSDKILRSAQDDRYDTWQLWIADLRRLTLVVVVWLLVRAGLLMALYLHRVLRSDPDRPLHTMNHFFSPWMLLLLLIVPALLAWRFVRGQNRQIAAPAPHEEEPDRFAAASTRRKSNGKTQNREPAAVPLDTEVPCPPLPRSPLMPSRFRLPVVAGLIGLAVALFTVAIYWCPVGGRKDGRVMVVERHSKWEPTTKPYDTKWYVDPEPYPDVNSGYNYARIYRYLGQYYDMSRLLEKDKIDDDTLAKCDVLIIKIPTERYSPEEAAAVTRFVEQGGGLLLIGDHTNYEGSSTAMNDITRPMGFIFRDDLLFSFNESPYEQLFVPPAVPHPAVQHVPPMDFAVSCSIDPGSSHGRPVIANTGLWSMGPEYHSWENFLPVPNHCPEMRYGAFVQTWAAQHEKGRAIAFADSTIFSNFCVGQPGKSEVMLGMVEWLNHANPWLDPRPWLLVLGLLPLAAGFWMVINQGTVPIFVSAKMGLSPSTPASPPAGIWLVLLAAGTCGWVIASLAVVGAHRWAMPTPECPTPERRERCVVIDRNTSTVPLSKGPDTQGGGEGYGLFEQWLARLDCHTVRKEGPEAFSGDVLVAVCPSRSVPEEFRQQLVRYVDGGGKLLVIDSPENTDSTADKLLSPFGLSINHDRPWKGSLTTAIKVPEVEVANACTVVGGKPVARIGEYPVAATVRHGKGSVMAVGFGSLWNDTRMGETWMLEPDPAVKARYNILFGLLRPFFDDKPWPAFPPPATEKKDDGKNPPLKESGPAEL
jgi:hypothetical protein